MTAFKLLRTSSFTEIRRGFSLAYTAFSLYEVVRVTCLSRSWFIYAPGGFARLTEATRTTS